MQCAEYQDGIRVQNGIITMPQQNHLHNLGTYVPECKQPKAGLAQTKHPSSRCMQFTFNEPPRFSVADMSLLHLLHVCTIPHLSFTPYMSQIFSSLLTNYQLLIKAADCKELYGR